MTRRERFVRWWSDSEWEGRENEGIGYRLVDGRAVLSRADLFKMRVRDGWREWRGHRKTWKCWPSVKILNNLTCSKLQQVSMHEIGHALSLSGHNSNKPSVLNLDRPLGPANQLNMIL